MNSNLREKHGEYYAVFTYRDELNHRKEKWVPLRIQVREHGKKKAEELLAKLSKPNAFDPNDLRSTNALLLELGLFPFDSSWRVVRGEAPVEKKMGRPVEAAPIPAIPSQDISEQLSGLKKGKKILFSDYLAIWYNIHKDTISLTSQASLSGMVFHAIIPWFRDQGITLTGIQPEDIEAFYREEMALGKGTNTCRHYHSAIRSALQYAFKKGYVINNVADRVDKPKKGDFKGDFYDEKELETLFQAAKGTNLEFAVLMGAYYGLRREEVCGLKWNAVDFQYKTITIRHTVGEVSINGKQKLILKDSTKNQSSFRTLPLSDFIANKLLEMKMKQDKMKEFFGNRYNHDFDEYIYVFENGDLVRPSWVTYNFRKLLQDKGMRKIRFHDLRHSCATLLRHEGVPMEDIQKWLGHSAITTTESIYAHFDEGKNKQTLETISDALDEDGQKPTEKKPPEMK
jgi:integrase